jgi:hypothetical protein
MGRFLNLRILLVTIQPQSLENTKKHKEIEMSQIATTRDAGLCFVIWITLRNKTGSIMALENIKNDNYGFLCETSCLSVFVAKRNQAE